MPSVVKVPLPAGSLSNRMLPRVDYADAYRIEVHASAALGLDDVFMAFFRAAPPWISFLMRVRNRLAGMLGLKTGADEDFPRSASFRVEKGYSRGLFKVLEKTDREAVVGEDDKHLDFRVSVHLDPLPGSAPYAYALTLSTIVLFHNRIGKLYFAVVKPFHHLIVPAMLRGIAKRLRVGVSAEERARAGKVNPVRGV
jgi:hypothetical protein